MPALAGGPPVRVEMLPMWEPAAPLAAPAHAAWLRAAQRIAAGVWELAHLPVTVDDEHLLIAFIDLNDPGVAAAADWVQAIRSEHVEARVLLDGAGQAGVQLPCAPEFSDEEIRHVVLACVKAAHVGAAPLPEDVADHEVTWREL